MRCTVYRPRLASWLKTLPFAQKKCMYGAPHHVHSQHGSGAVNLVVSRKSGGPVRAPGNAGDKRVKRKRGGRSAAAVAARIERGYLKRTRTAGGTACVHNHVDSKGTGTDGSSHPAAQRTSATARDGGDLTQERERLAQEVQSMTGTPGQRVRAGVVDTRVICKPDQFDGDPMKYADWSFKLGSYLGARDLRYQELTTTETSSTPRLNATLGSEDSALSTQMYYILVMTTAGSALDKCHNAGVNEGFEARRQFVTDWEPKLRARCVGLFTNVLGYRFRDDIPNKPTAFERLVHDYENHSTTTVDDDIKIGVTMLGMEDMRVKEHLIRNSVRITSWNQMRETIFEITRTQQYIDCQPMPMQLGANPKSKGKGKDGKNESSKKAKNVLLLQQVRPQEGRVQKDTERSCRCREKTGGSVATSKQHSGGRAVAVLTPRRETHVNVRHSHALCEQRNVLRVFQ